jgi:hypothetical protein
VLEDREPGHQSRRQRRMAGIIRVDLAEAPLQEARRLFPQPLVLRFQINGLGILHGRLS